MERFILSEENEKKLINSYEDNTIPFLLIMFSFTWAFFGISLFSLALLGQTIDAGTIIWSLFIIIFYVILPLSILIVPKFRESIKCFLSNKDVGPSSFAQSIAHKNYDIYRVRCISRYQKHPKSEKGYFTFSDNGFVREVPLDLESYSVTKENEDIIVIFYGIEKKKAKCFSVSYFDSFVF
jgi:hypothetical protein